MGIIISGVGSYIPQKVTTNSSFLNHEFLDSSGATFEAENDVIIKKFKAITGIEERRYAKDHHTTSDLGFFAAERAIEDAQCDPETIDYIICAHNFGDVKKGCSQSDLVPSLATRIKHSLQIKNPGCVAYDILFGCPGWIEGVIQAQAFIKAGMAKRCLVIGTEALSRVIDPHDRDSMIYGDGAGATIIEYQDNEKGILSTNTATYTYEEAYYLNYAKTYNQEGCEHTKYLKMNGRKIYNFALSNVPAAMKACLDKSNISIDQVKKIFIHQANEKMDEAISSRFFGLYDTTPTEGVMPMSIHKLGNSSVATVPTLFDLVAKGQIENQNLNSGDIILFASVGAGMNVNAIAYRY